MFFFIRSDSEPLMFFNIANPSSLYSPISPFLYSFLYSSNEKIFKEATPVYEEALKKSGYDKKLSYTPQKQSKSNKNRKRNIIWFNPPFSNNVSTKIGKHFLTLLDAHFPPHHKFNKIFNRNSVKISYSCTKNIKSIINDHNNKIIRVNENEEINNVRKCNCTKKDECPLNGKCLTKNIVYEATVTSNEPTYKEKKYIGISEPTFKKRYANHKKSFNINKYKNETELSKEVWRIKNSNYIPQIKWNILRVCPPYNQSSNKCSLCLNEKLLIALYNKDNLLNKRNELVSKCRHVNKYTLLRHDTND